MYSRLVYELRMLFGLAQVAIVVNVFLYYFTSRFVTACDLKDIFILGQDCECLLVLEVQIRHHVLLLYLFHVEFDDLLKHIAHPVRHHLLEHVIIDPIQVELVLRVMQFQVSELRQLLKALEDLVEYQLIHRHAFLEGDKTYLGPDPHDFILQLSCPFYLVQLLFRQLGQLPNGIIVNERYTLHPLFLR